ncbi:hypothetical protein [Kordia sp. SMS9]|uniref:hypothetical protein n=1 Tax=Kordia sp. SMS9 TaxID=2282170 RepID=UPI000E0D9C54|nr:hypothetical protein [Kordia sp. SMS9]
MNVALPWTFALFKIGNAEGEIILAYIAFAIWSVACLFLYTIYFAIPDFTKSWETSAAFVFPSVFLVPVLFWGIELFSIPFGMNLLFNCICLFIYKKRMRNG